MVLHGRNCSIVLSCDAPGCSRETLDRYVQTEADAWKFALASRWVRSDDGKALCPLHAHNAKEQKSR